jgi:olfactory receptor
MAILKIQTTDERMKDFSSCSSHLAGVSIQYGTVFFIYVQPSTYTSLNTNKVISLFYTVMISMLNPLIYSLRNKEMKNALRRKVQRKHFSRDW